VFHKFVCISGEPSPNPSSRTPDIQGFYTLVCGGARFYVYFRLSVISCMSSPVEAGASSSGTAASLDFHSIRTTAQTNYTNFKDLSISGASGLKVAYAVILLSRSGSTNSAYSERPYLSG
jgi:hypothetical protein